VTAKPENQFGETTVQTAEPQNQYGNPTTTTVRPTAQPELGYLAFLILLLIIPFIFLLFICCCARRCQMFTCICMPCCRPAALIGGKCCDMAVSYMHEDKFWIERFISEVNIPPEYNYAVCHHCMGVGADCCSNDSLRVFKNAKRIVLAFTEEFNKNAFNNPAFIRMLRHVYRYEPNCVIIAVCFGIDETFVRKQLLHKIEGPFLYDDKNNENAVSSDFSHSWPVRIARHVRYQCGLNSIEVLDYEDASFYRKFHYLMPRNDGCCSCRVGKDGRGYTLEQLRDENRRLSVDSGVRREVKFNPGVDPLGVRVYMAGEPIASAANKYSQLAGSDAVLELNYDFNDRCGSGQSPQPSNKSTEAMIVSKKKADRKERARLDKMKECCPGEYDPNRQASSILNMFAPNPNRVIHIDEY
jgi:hypothetical protein